MFVNAWKDSHKLAWGVHRACRTYLVLEVLAPHVPPIRADLFSRFHSFFKSLFASPSHKVSVVAQMAARNARSNLGSNLGLLTERTGLDPWVATYRDIQTALWKADRVGSGCLEGDIPPGPPHSEIAGPRHLQQGGRGEIDQSGKLLSDELA